MTNSKKAKRFQFWINVVLILITLSIILPFVLVFISSLTDENTLIRNGYSFFPEKFSFYAYSYIRFRLKSCRTAEQLPFSYSSRCCSTADWCRPT